MKASVQTDKPNTFAANNGASLNGSLPLSVGGGAGETGKTASPLLSSLTRSQRIEAERRQATLARVEQFKREGKSEEQAARLCGTSPVSLWRWRTQGIIPQTQNCGRRSKIKAIAVPAELLSTIRRLQLAGRGNAAAWKSLRDDPRMPPKIAAHLKTRASVHPWLLAQTKLKRRTARVLECADFVHVIKA